MSKDSGVSELALDHKYPPLIGPFSFLMDLFSLLYESYLLDYVKSGPLGAEETAQW